MCENGDEPSLHSKLFDAAAANAYVLAELFVALIRSGALTEEKAFDAIARGQAVTAQHLLADSPVHSVHRFFVAYVRRRLTED